MEEAVREKRRCFKLWKAGGSRAAYNTAKRTSNRAVHQARSEAEKVALQKIDPRSGDVYRLAKQMRRDNQDVMGEKPVSEVEVGNKKLEVVPEFCYLGDMLSAGGGCELAAITRCKCAWGKFRKLLPLLTNRHLPLLTRGKVYSSCVRSVMLHAAERLGP